MKYVYRVLLSVAGIGVLLVGWVKYQESSGIFFPRAYPEARLDRLPGSIEFVRFESSDGVGLTGLLKKGQPDSPAIVFTHGNAGHMIDRLPWLRNGVPEGWTGMIVDYRGYGQSKGSPSVSGVKRDARSAVEYVLEQADVSDLYLYGRSLGAPMAAYASQFYETKGIILESGFPDARTVAPHFLPVPGVSYLVGVEMNTVGYIEEAERKYGPMRKLIVHGTEDRILPFSLGKKLYERLPEPKQKLFVEGAGHNNLRRMGGELYRDTFREFLTGRSRQSSSGIGG